MNITRREFGQRAGVLALAGAALTVLGPALGRQLGLDWLRPAQAAGDPSPEELMKPGPLPEMVMGDANAPVTIIEYASMTCPHCAHFHETTYPEMKKRYVDTGKVRFIFREFPLDPLAAAGFMLARCSTQNADAAAASNRYFAMIETLFQQQKDWVVEKPLNPLFGIAKQAGFSKESFDKCLADQPLFDQIKAVRTQAEKFGVESTPTFFINGKKAPGALTIDELAKQVEPYLKS